MNAEERGKFDAIIIIFLAVVLSVVVFPALFSGQIKGNEMVAVAGLKAIYRASQDYKRSRNLYPDKPGLLRGLPNIDDCLAAGQRQGYSFYITGNTELFGAVARPLHYRRTGLRSFYVDGTGLIHFTENNSEPGSHNPLLEKGF